MAAPGIGCLRCKNEGIRQANAVAEKEIESYIAEVDREWVNLPPMKESVEYTEYKLAARKSDSHHSLLFIYKLARAREYR